MTLQIKKKISDELNTVRMCELFDISVGLQTGFISAFLVDEYKLKTFNDFERTFCHPTIETDSVVKYGIDFKNKYIIIIPRGWTNANMPIDADADDFIKSTFPNIIKHLRSVEKRFAGVKRGAMRTTTTLETRATKGDYGWELRNTFVDFDLKLITPVFFNNSIRCTLTDEFISTSSLIDIKSDNSGLLEALCVLMHSKLFVNIFVTYFCIRNNNCYRLHAKDLKRTTVPKKLIDLAMFYSSCKESKEDMSSVVADMYGLTPDDVDYLMSLDI